MPSQSPFRIELTKDEHAILEKRAAAHTAPYWEVVRARIVLLAAEGTSNKEIAADRDLLLGGAGQGPEPQRFRRS